MISAVANARVLFVPVSTLISVSISLAASALWACTLTAESFEPSPVDSARGGLDPESSEALPLSVDAGAADPPSSTGNEGSNLDGVALEPGAAGDGGGGVGSAAAPGAQPSDGSRPDAGESSEVDAAPQPSSNAACPGETFAGSCYQAFTEFLAWDVAEQRCVEWGGHLASVESAEEQTFLDYWPTALSVPLGDGSGVWLGGTDAVNEGDFRWWDGRPLMFMGWAPNQPDNGPGVDCVEKRNDGTGLWYDRRCSEPRAYICERPL